MKILRHILRVFRITRGSRKKNGFSKSWKVELNQYGKRSRIKNYIPPKIKKILKILVFPETRRDFISRTDKRKKYFLMLVKATGVSVVAVIVIAALHKPGIEYLSSLEFFKIKEIGIYGCTITNPPEIKEIAGFDYNKSMFSLNPDRAVLDLLAHPWIRKAEVKRVWPNGIAVEIQEHMIAALMVKGGSGQEKMVYINEIGVSIEQVKAGEELDYPVITGLHNILEEQKASAVEDAVMFLRLISENNPNLPAQSVSEIHLDHIEGLIIRLVEFPFPIYFGRGNVINKYKQLRNVLAVLYKKQKNNVDISQVEYIRMDYLKNKVLVAQTNSG